MKYQIQQFFIWEKNKHLLPACNILTHDKIDSPPNKIILKKNKKILKKVLTNKTKYVIINTRGEGNHPTKKRGNKKC